MKKWLLLSSLFLSFSYKSYEPNQTLDTHMSPDEKQQTGVHKLNPKEKKSLLNWINQNLYVRPGAKRYDKKAPEVSEVIGNGAYVKLSDGSIWQIHPSDRLLTQSWISAAEITVEKTGGSTYNYVLKNNLTGSSVRAEKVSNIPKYLQGPKKSVEKHSPSEHNPSEKKKPGKEPSKRSGYVDM